MRTKRMRRLGWLILLGVLMVVVAMSGCGPNTLLNAYMDPAYTRDAPFDGELGGVRVRDMRLSEDPSVLMAVKLPEREKWVFGKLEEAREVLGEQDGWRAVEYPERSWEELVDPLKHRMPTGDCTVIGVTGRVFDGWFSHLTLKREVPEGSQGDADKLASHWQEQGWSIYEILSLARGDSLQRYRAVDAEARALEVWANETVIMVTAESACSVTNARW